MPREIPLNLPKTVTWSTSVDVRLMLPKYVTWSTQVEVFNVPIRVNRLPCCIEPSMWV
jgi:hypothetical protein